MHALIEFIVGLVALLAAAAFAQFGVDVNGPRTAEPEVRRVSDCPDVAPRALVAKTADAC